MDTLVTLDKSQPGLFKKLQRAIREKHFNNRTAENYRHWIARYVFFNDFQNPNELGAVNVLEFLTYLKTRMKLSRAKLNQATLALEFFYSQVLKTPLESEELAMAV